MAAFSAHPKLCDDITYSGAPPAVDLGSIAVRHDDVIHGFANIWMIVRDSGDLQNTLMRQIFGARAVYVGMLLASNTGGKKW